MCTNKLVRKGEIIMKKILTLAIAFMITIAGLAASAATPQDVLAFLNQYITAANSYSDTITTFYAPDAKIIKEGYNAAGKKVSVVVDTKQYFHQMRIGSNLAKLNKYKNNYSDRKITKVGNDYKIECIRVASTGADKFPSYFVIGPDSNGKLKIKEEMTWTKQQSILKHGN